MEPVETFRAIQEMLQRPGAGEERVKLTLLEAKTQRHWSQGSKITLRTLRIFTWETSRFLSSWSTWSTIE